MRCGDRSNTMRAKVVLSGGTQPSLVDTACRYRLLEQPDLSLGSKITAMAFEEHPRP